MTDTLGSMRASVVAWLRGAKVDQGMIDDAINDANESLWETLLRVCLSIFMGGPTSLTLAAGTEGAIMVSITDPTVAPVVSNTPATDPALGAHTVDVAYTYVTESGSETLLSPITTFTTALGNVASVHPPAIVQNAIGWNCYARGFAAGNLVKQNDEPLPFLTNGGNNFNEPDTGFTNDPDDPWPPTENTTGDNIFYIRHMEVVTSNGNLKSWTQGDLDSDLMRRFGLFQASSSDLQNYGFDLINQRQIEIRPAMGATLTARYFWIVKPRRLRFSNSPLPFPTIPSTEFVRDFALSKIFLSLREIEVSNSWRASAEQARSRCELAVTTMNRPRNQRVTPFRT